MLLDDDEGCFPVFSYRCVIAYSTLDHARTPPWANLRSCLKRYTHWKDCDQFHLDVAIICYTTKNIFSYTHSFRVTLSLTWR